MLGYDRALVCENGHYLADELNRYPDLDAKFCKLCGGASLKNCQCGAPIRGVYATPHPTVHGWETVHRSETPPAFCHECGKPYPWSVRRAEALADVLDELDDLPDEEREKLKGSIPDLLAETPKSELAATRYKKAITKLGGWGGKLLADTISKVAVESVKVLMFGS